jgi:hypothetical protein
VAGEKLAEFLSDTFFGSVNFTLRNGEDKQ